MPRKVAREVTHPERVVELPSEPSPGDFRRRPLVFISHDHRDADLAEAFANLLTDVSGGFIKSFRSSDRRGTSGIEFGSEWYSTVMSRLDHATDVVALLTPNSLDRPWILYEAGVAKGKLGTIVFGIAINIPLAKASQGPFAQFQNSDDTEDSLTELVLQLIKRNTDAEPREEAVRRQVAVFRENIARRRPTAPEPPVQAEVDPSAMAKLFEEIKIMFKELPDRIQGQLTNAGGIGRSGTLPLPPPHVLVSALTRDLEMRQPTQFIDTWRMLMRRWRNDLPTVYHKGMQVYRALSVQNIELARKSILDFNAMAKTTDPEMLRDFADGNDRDAEEQYFVLSQLPLLLETYFVRHVDHPANRAARRKTEINAASE